MVYLDMCRFEECVTDCNEAIKIDPLFPKSYYRKAKALIGLQKLSDAVETLKESLEMIPENEDLKTLMTTTVKDIKIRKEGFKVEKTFENNDGPNPETGNILKIHYKGMLVDGTVFDSTYERGTPMRFPLGHPTLVKGWNEGFKQLRKGEKAIFTCPPEYAYGAQEIKGMVKVPANSTVIYEVDLLDFVKEMPK